MITLVLVLAAVAGPPEPKLPVGRDTTVVDGPLDADGYIDYEAALNDRLARGVTPATNACVLLWLATGPRPEGQSVHPDYFARLGVPPPPAGGRYFVTVEDYFKGRGREPEDFRAVATRLSRQPWTAKEHLEFAAWLDANAGPLATVEQATRRPGYYNPLVSRDKDDRRGLLIGSPLWNLQKCRAVGDALAKRAMFHAGEGRADAAWADLLTARLLARQLANGGTLIELLVGHAIEATAVRATPGYLAACPPTAARAVALVRDLDALPPLAGPADKVALAERLTFLDSVQHLRRGGPAALAEFAGQKKPAVADERLMALLDWGLILRLGNRWFDRAVQVCRTPGRADREAAMRTFENDLRELNASAKRRVASAQGAVEGKGDEPAAVREAVSEGVGGVLVSLLMPAVNKLVATVDRTTQQQRLTRVAVALAAYRADTGRYPDALTPLAPKYLPAVEPDLFTGKPLTYELTPDGYTLASTGPRGGVDTDDYTIRMPPATR